VWANEQRQSRLEKFVVRCITLFQVLVFRLQLKPYQLALVACLVVLFFVVLYVLLHDSPKSQAASHFTIPILSPFTSVVSLFVRYYDHMLIFQINSS
jgi:tryptophan-rich sensory protein